MDPQSLERARQRVEQARAATPDGVVLDVSLERARTALESFAETAAELEAAVPERLATAVQDGMRAEVLPVARHIAEVRGLTAQTIRRLERLQADVEAERRARVEDLALMVDLIASGWRGVERRLDRIERLADRMERSVEDRPAGALYRLEGRQERQPGA